MVIGGGAALGSGAFSTTEADRGLQVNVVTGDAIAEEFIDIVLKDIDNVENVGVDIDEVGSAFPTAGDDYDSYEASSGDLSLMDNDVTITFGDENSFLANSSRDFEDLIVLVNDEGDNSNGTVNVEFSATTESTFTFEAEVDEESKDFGDESDGDTVDDGEAVEVTVGLETGSTDDDDGLLEIEITDAQ
ncbi:hypothetical protein [Natronorubrum sp. A-ect3]|uniref:hypothetical protein n=1 Tax=Natronorubrum sp. A-ect3 TaxID=3242698 RepID=UPI00359CF821